MPALHGPPHAWQLFRSQENGELLRLREVACCAQHCVIRAASSLMPPNANVVGCAVSALGEQAGAQAQLTALLLRHRAKT